MRADPRKDKKLISALGLVAPGTAFRAGIDDIIRSEHGALIVIDHENVERWAQNKRIAFSDFTGLVRSDAVRDLIGAEIARVNGMFVEPIRSFRLIEHRLEPEDPELTPMMKLRRRFVSEKYRALLEAMS